ncbi:MAG: GspH/FimT family pseudopilin [Nitrospinae bacterium]|nr:GspH/FimT family pseudopilin [Nitrospinota bacterium]
MWKAEKTTTGTSSAGSDPAGRKAAGTSESGFTLLELVLVLFFMALITGLVTPFVMSTLDRMELQSWARKVTAALRYARSEAISIKKPVIFNGDLTHNQFWITHSQEDETPRVISLDDSVRLARFLNEEEAISDGKFTVTFFPQGNSSGGLIGIETAEAEESESHYVISIDPITGRTRIKEETE